MMQQIMFLVALGLIAWVVVAGVNTYRSTPGSSWLSAFEGSMTIAQARLKVVAAAAAGALMVGGDYLGVPAVSDAIKSVIDPKFVPFFLIVSAFLTEYARRRTL